jgi:hypothetical protein
VGRPREQARQHAGQRRQRGLGRRPAPEAHRDGEHGGEQWVVRAERPAAVELIGLDRQVDLVERPVPLVGDLVVDVEVAVLGQAEGGQEVLGLVRRRPFAVGGPGGDGDRSPGGRDQAHEGTRQQHPAVAVRHAGGRVGTGTDLVKYA